MKLKMVISLLACLAMVFTICPQTTATNEIFSEVMMEEVDDGDTSNYDVEYIDSFVLTAPKSTVAMQSAHRLNVTVNPNKIRRTTNSYSLGVDDVIVFDFTYTPALDSTEFRIGIYEINTKKTTYFVFSGGTLKGNYTLKTAGEYKIELKNLSTQAVTLSGTFIPCKFTNIGVPLIAQEDSNLCWAACSEMISEYYGCSVTQEAIVKHVKNTDTMVNETGTGRDIKKAIEYATGTKHTCSGSYTVATDISNISNEINNNRPVIMLFVNSAGNHVCVATATDDQDMFVRYNNPSPVNKGNVITAKYETITSSKTNKYTKYMTVS